MLINDAIAIVREKYETLPGGEIRNIQAGNVVELETVNLLEKMYCVRITPNP
jgi:hypothetical protein